MAKAISTWLSDGFIFIVRLFEFILFGNPLSMCVFNLFAPHKTAEFARNQVLFGEIIHDFYEERALKWPFFWARWWMKLDSISQYPIDMQIKYFLKVATKNKTEVETLKAMPRKLNGEIEFWPKAYETLFFKYGDEKLPYKETRWHMVGECSVGHWANVTVAEFMMRNVRLSWYALKKVVQKAAVDDDMRDELKKYLTRGKLNDSQFELLINAVTTDPGSGDLQMLGVLLDYIKCYGISKKYMERINEQYPSTFGELVAEANTFYVQMKAHKAFKKSSEGLADWSKFCSETPKIIPEVQQLMSIEQYKIFHNVGHQLDISALKKFLSSNDKKLWHAVFINEKEACRSGEIREYIRGDANLELAYRDTLEMQRKTGKK